MRHLKSILLLSTMLLFVGTLGAQEETTKKKNTKKAKKEMAEKAAQEEAEKAEVVEDTMMKEVEKPAEVEFQEPAFAMSIEQGAKANSAGIYNAYSMEILNADKKVVEKAWRSLMKSYKGKTKFNKREAEMGTTNARISELGSAIYSVKASIEQRGDNVVVHSWYEGADGYIDEGSDMENSGVQEVLDAFAVDVRKRMVKIELDGEEKILKQSESELKKLKRQNDSYHKDIEIAKRKIAEAEQNIIENEAAQEASVAKIDGQRVMVEAVRKRLRRIN